MTSVSDPLEPAIIATAISGGQLEPNRQNRFLVLLLDSLLLTCFLAAVLILCNKPACSMDEDLWWHLRTGNWIIENHAVPIRDHFAAYTSGQPWIVYTWLFDVLIAKIYAYWQLPGVLAFTGISILGAISALLALLWRYTALQRAVGLTMGALFGIGTLASPRPWLFTVLFFITELYFLLRARETGRPVWLLPVVPLLALWANLHIQFTYGLLTIGIFAIEGAFASFVKWGPSSNRLPARWLWLLLLVAGCATLANPYGWHLYSVVLQYGGQSAPLFLIQEMQSAQFRSIADWVPLLITCLSIYALAGLKEKYPVFALLLAVSCWFAFRAARDVWFLVSIDALILAHSWRVPASPVYRWRCLPWAFALPISLAIGNSLLHSARNSDASLRVEIEKRFPEKAAAYIQAHALRDPLYNTFDWGGFLIWRLPTMPVSIDGRANLHGDSNLLRFADTWLGKSNWADDPHLKRAQTILLDRNCGLASILRSDHRYRLVYEDSLASVFQTSDEP